jgi:hypothetical protein
VLFIYQPIQDYAIGIPRPNQLLESEVLPGLRPNSRPNSYIFVLGYSMKRRFEPLLLF